MLGINLRAAIFALYNINRLVFITEMWSVYSAVRTGPINKPDYTSSLKGKTERHRMNHGCFHALLNSALNRYHYESAIKEAEWSLVE